MGICSSFVVAWNQMLYLRVVESYPARDTMMGI